MSVLTCTGLLHLTSVCIAQQLCPIAYSQNRILPYYSRQVRTESIISIDAEWRSAQYDTYNIRIIGRKSVVWKNLAECIQFPYSAPYELGSLGTEIQYYYLLHVEVLWFSFFGCKII